MDILFIGGGIYIPINFKRQQPDKIIQTELY